MKKILLLALIVLSCSGCAFGKDKLEDSTIYTTISPITYLMDTLYGEYSEISSIYPADADLDSYELTDKQIKEYAECDLFIYNGTTNEKNTAREFINNNNDILIIDAAHSLTINESVEELWLSPNNYLMLAKNIKNNLIEYVTRVDIVEAITSNYDELAETLSIMDADLRKIGETAVSKNKNIIVASSDAFKYLENYGFKIISMDDETNKTDDAINNIKQNLIDNNYLTLINEYGNDNELINSIKDDNTNVINISTMHNANADMDYISIMHEFISNLETIVDK